MNNGDSELRGTRLHLTPSISFFLPPLDLFLFSPWISHSKAGVDFARKGLVAPASGQ